MGTSGLNKDWQVLSLCDVGFGFSDFLGLFQVIMANPEKCSTGISQENSKRLGSVGECSLWSETTFLNWIHFPDTQWRWCIYLHVPSKLPKCIDKWWVNVPYIECLGFIWKKTYKENHLPPNFSDVKRTPSTWNLCAVSPATAWILNLGPRQPSQLPRWNAMHPDKLVKEAANGDQSGIIQKSLHWYRYWGKTTWCYHLSLKIPVAPP